MTKKLTNEEIIAFVKDKGAIKASQIYTEFEAQGYTQGQISGVLFRLKSLHKLIQPQKGYYQVLQSTNALLSFKLELESVYGKYEKAEVASLLEMEKSEMECYVQTLRGLKDLINKID